MNYRGVNDYELIYRIRENNDEVAINDLILKYEPVIAGIARKYCVGDYYKGVDFNDFMQEGRMAVVKAMKTYEFEQSVLFYTYVSVCINRQLLTYCRKLGTLKHNVLSNSFSDDCFLLYGDVNYEPYSYFDSRSYENWLKVGLNMLDLMDSCVLELRYNGFSCCEIGTLLDLPIYNVSRRLCKIKRTLQDIKNKF